MGTKSTLLLIFTLVPLSFFVALYLLNPTYTTTLIAGIKNYAITTVSTFFGNITKNPATAVVPVLGATSVIGGIAYKIVGKIKAKAAAAELVAQQSQSQTYEISDALKQEIQKTQTLEEKLAVYEKDGDAVTALKQINSDLQLKIDNMEATHKTVVDSLTTQRDTIQRDFQTVLKQMFTDPTVKKNIVAQELYEKYVVT